MMMTTFDKLFTAWSLMSYYITDAEAKALDCSLTDRLGMPLDAILDGYDLLLSI